MENPKFYCNIRAGGGIDISQISQIVEGSTILQQAELELYPKTVKYGRDIWEETLEKLSYELELTRFELSEIKKEVEELRSVKNIKSNVIVLQDVPFDNAKGMIEIYLKKHKKAFLSDIVNDLKLDLRLAHKVIEILKEEGKLE